RLRDDRRTGRAAPAKIEPRTGVCDQRLAGSTEARDDGVAVSVGEVHEEAAARRGIRRERHSEQAALPAGQHGRGKVEKIPREDGSALYDANPARLLDHVLNVP